MHYASYGLIGYTMKIIRGAARIACSHPRRQITLRTLSQSYAEHVWSERLDDPNPFAETFDCEKAPPIALPSATACIPPGVASQRTVRLELGTHGARLLFRVEPIAGARSRGYLCRAAHEHGYCSPVSLAQIAGLQVSCLDREDTIEQLSYALRLEPEEWRSMCYHHVKGQNRFKQRSFCGQRVSADDLNYRRPRLCSACLRERPIWWAVWDLGLVVACPIHRCFLFNQCPACNRRVAWRRPSVHKCRCGLDFRDLAPEAADSDLVAINAAIYRAAGFPSGEVAELDLTNYGLPRKCLS